MKQLSDFQNLLKISVLLGLSTMEFQYSHCLLSPVKFFLSNLQGLQEKIQKIQTPKKITVIILKLEQCGFNMQKDRQNGKQGRP